MLSTSFLPLAACLLLIVDMVLWPLSPWLKSTTFRIVAILLLIAVSALPVFSLIPIMQLPLMLYVRAIFGDPGIITLAILLAHFLNYFRSYRKEGIRPATVKREIYYICLITVPVSLILFPTALGWTYFDPYAHGYYPTTLSVILLSLFILCFLERFYFIASVLAASFLAYALQLMDSDNLWNYLTDPLLLVYGIYIFISDREEWARVVIPEHVIQKSLLILAGIYALFGILLSHANEQAFNTQFVSEYSFTEFGTFVLLLALSFIFFKRAWKLKSARSTGFVSVTLLIAVLCASGGVLELFPVDMPLVHPLQKTPLMTSLGTLITLPLLIVAYLLITTLLYKTNSTCRKFINAYAVPVATNLQIGCYLSAMILIELAIDSPMRDELLQFVVTIVIMLNLAFPLNRNIYHSSSEKV